ncbi:hypothetical protein C8J57DRAFT_1718219 [Mycena rebaudengoi]|nr:hypothetical protein C8J57DRAFT_1718219 [Mycena rebaudengoi]
MFNKLLFTALLSILVLGQGAVSVPQEVPRTCGGPYDVPCPKGTFCCVPGPVPVFGTPPKPGHCIGTGIIWAGSLPLHLELVLRIFPSELIVGVIVPYSTVNASRET